MQQVEFVDSTLCAAQQAIWKSPLPLEKVQPVLGQIGRTGFCAVDALDPAAFSASVRALHEDPLLRLRLIASRMPPATPVSVWTACGCLFGDAALSEGLLALGYRRLRDNGATRHYCHDPLNDPANLEAAFALAEQAGLETRPVLVFTGSPVHDDAYFADRAAALASLAPQAVCLYDPGSLLQPTRADALLPRVVGALDGVPLEFRTTARSGQAERICLQAVAHGARALHVALQPLAGGDSLPPLRYLIEHLRREGKDFAIDETAVAAVEDYLAGLADLEGLPLGEHRLPDWGFDRHQMSDALAGQAMAMLNGGGSPEELQAVLDEAAQVRADLGFPAMAPPVDAAIARQAGRNVAERTRYATLEDTLARVALGMAGAPAGAIAAEVKRRAEGQPLPPPVEARSQDDDGVLAAHFTADELRPVCDGRTRMMDQAQRAATDDPVDFLLHELERRDVRRFAVAKGAFHLSLGTAPR